MKVMATLPTAAEYTGIVKGSDKGSDSGTGSDSNNDRGSGEQSGSDSSDSSVGSRNDNDNKPEPAAETTNGPKVTLTPAPNTAHPSDADAPFASLSPRIEAFVRSHNHPFMTEFDAHNFRHLSGLNKVMVMAVIQVSLWVCSSV